MSDARGSERKKVQIWCSSEDLAEIDEGARLDDRNRTSFMIAAAKERARKLKRERGEE